jgi:hypothetical protein
MQLLISSNSPSFAAINVKQNVQQKHCKTLHQTTDPTLTLSNTGVIDMYQLNLLTSQLTV